MASPAPNKQSVCLSRHSVTSGAPEEMFSPTSAAAWALSTMHNFGAAAPPHNTTIRPSVEALTGTRLFNSAARSSGTIKASMDSSTATTQRPTTFMKGNSSSTISWGELKIHRVNSFVGPSPPVSRSGTDQTCHASNTAISGPSKPSRLASAVSFVTPTPKKHKSEQRTHSSAPHIEDAATYSRKNKSLGVLAENFIKKFQPYPSGYDIVVDSAAKELGVERRRIYDVVNILESIQLVSKEKKNTYKWMGTYHMNHVFGKLQEQAIMEYPEDAKNLLRLSQDELKSTTTGLCRPASPKNNVNKSLAKLSQEFLQVYLVGFKTLSLPEASDKIQGATSMEELISLGGGPNLRMNPDGSPNHEDEKQRKAAAARGLKTKIRRLYDIANVFISVGLLRKIETSATGTSRRPNFSWNYKLNPREIRALYLQSMDKQTDESSSVATPPAVQVDKNEMEERRQELFAVVGQASNQQHQARKCKNHMSTNLAKQVYLIQNAFPSWSVRQTSGRNMNGEASHSGGQNLRMNPDGSPSHEDEKQRKPQQHER
ncbi:E2F/DP family winged-helix DNA-binding domain containing protein [Nitzschia inconspicua]|uniref:E2F/DP family winged-helix DNA-binding domain containing protein n=1 Tax=Nitzschia inconspicua TaxID=303405 RepID=A0A9K3KD92_9STRA|nr:E2F/DP family winged-helix DNA-binding domain containing protein [Nitzschia inconspicua]